MESKPIKDFVKDDRIEGFFIVRKKDVREYIRGQYVSLELGDATGRVNAVMWEPDRFALDDLAEGMVVKVRGQVGEYRNKTQLTISRIRQAETDEYALETVLPHSRFSLEERRGRILCLTEQIENTYVRQLAEAFWNDEDFFHRYLVAPAGKLWHHAYVGGLSEHCATVTELTLKVSQHYDFLDRDLLIFGGLFHDAGKLATYTSGMVFDYTDEGRLVGHICLADEWICRRAAGIEGFPETLLVKLRHMILAHQGELEFASPVKPQIPEAFVLYYCDEIDSKMGAIDRIRTRHDGHGWSDYVKMLDRFLYFGEPPEE